MISRKLCKNWCSQNGFCTRGICNCNPGYSGEDCSSNICSVGQYYIATNNSCVSGASLNCPDGTYANKYDSTCLSCSSSCTKCTR